MPFYTELVALMRKDATTIAALLIHLQRARLQVDYNLLLFRAAALIRLFKHLMVNYAEEFGHSLRLLIEQNMELRPADNQKRLARFKTFHEDPSMLALLKRASVSLQLMQHATAIACRESGPEPALKQLASQKVEQATSSHLQSILANFSRDLSLDLDDVVLTLWMTQSHICIRFHVFTKWPYKIWTLSKQFNAAVYLHSMDQFLQEDELAPDAGYSLLLRRQSLACGDTASAAAFLAVLAVQKELDDIVTFYMASASASKTSLIVGDSKLYEAWHSKKHFDQTLLADTNMVDKDKAAAIEKLMQKDDWRSEVQASLATSLTQAYLEMLSELPFTRSFGNRPLQTIRKQH
ncbi:unnamed protein product [Symbiodinium microadriaticum]|nr:unnamed protein product [Symbiodinium microadriaticum]